MKSLFRAIGLLLILIPSVTFSQKSNKEQLAKQYLKNEEFDKATDIYEQLHQEDLSNKLYYQNYYSLLIKTNEFERAEKMLKKQIKKFNNYPLFIIDLGQLYIVQKLNEKANKEFDKAANSVTSEINTNNDIVSRLMEYEQFEYAEKAIRKSRAVMKDPGLFTAELAKIFNIQNNKAGIIEEQLDLLEINYLSIQQVQNSFQDYLSDSKDLDLLKVALLKKSQKSPDNNQYYELLIWTLIQQRNFESALMQTIAFDKRLGEQGTRVFAFADFCRSNNAFDVAIKSYQYIIELGVSNPQYQEARLQQLITRKDKILSNTFTNQDLETIDIAYQTFLKEYGENSTSSSAMRDYANLLAMYLNKPNEAIQLLETIISKNLGSSIFINKCKLELGDIYLINNEIWEASLLYGQVDKANRDEPIGQQAKFRNAKLAYYTGEFDWAKSQLDVLKASTSQLIANDALNLSLLISDNSNLDSNTDALNKYAQADLLIVQNKFAQAELKLDSIDRIYPNHELADDILWTRSQIALKQKKYSESIDFLSKIINNYNDGIWSDDALFGTAQIFELYLKDQTKAMEYYKKIVEEQPGSLFVVEARKRYRILRGDIL